MISGNIPPVTLRAPFVRQQPVSVEIHLLLG